VNEGNAAAKITQITIRGIECSWSNIYFWKTNIGSVSGDFEASLNDLSGSTVAIDIEGEDRIFKQATQEIILNSFHAIVLYLKNPGNITQNDVLGKTTVAVFTEKSMCSKEITIYSATVIEFTGSASLSITDVDFVDGTPKTISVDVVNSDTASATITTAKVNNAVVQITDSPVIVDVDKSTTLVLTANWIAGNAYKIDLYDNNGQVVGSYQATAA
jgi:hypothetical protein